MNIIKVIRRHFDFLLENNYICTIEKTRLQHCVSYTKEKMEFSVCYDIREDKLDFALRDLSRRDAEPHYITLPTTDCVKQDLELTVAKYAAYTKENLKEIALRYRHNLFLA